MAIQQTAPMYRTTDGQEFASQADAERHEALSTAKRDYENASAVYDRLLAESQFTADGHPFRVSVLHTYYYVTNGLSGAPAVGTVAFFCRNFYLGSDDEVTITQQEDGKRDRTFWFKQLYARRENAERAQLAEFETWLEERHAECAALRTRLTKGEAH